MGTLKEYIKSNAINLGFDRVGIARAQEVDQLSWDKFLYWLENYSADMGWMHNYLDLRHDPRNVLPSAKSVIVTGHNYFVREHTTENNKIAKYAWGRDYHKVVKNKLHKLATLIKQKYPELEYRPFVDTGPVWESYWAAQAGVGWVGRNSLIIDKEIGSYMFLGVLLVNIELEPDELVADMCGGCTLCIDSCPPQAILPGKLVDSSLCISYQTIENRGDIPDDIDLSVWVYGCDICQDVCPYNTFRAITSEPDFLNINPARAEFDTSNISEEDYDKITNGSSMRRAKYSQFRRNMEHNR